MKATFLRSNLINVLKKKKNQNKAHSSCLRHFASYQLGIYWIFTCTVTLVLFITCWPSGSFWFNLRSFPKCFGSQRLLELFYNSLTNESLCQILFFSTLGMQACRASEFRTRCPGCEPLQLTKDLRFTCWVYSSSLERPGLTHWCPTSVPLQQHFCASVFSLLQIAPKVTPLCNKLLTDCFHWWWK